jgi:hypothetical protein
VLAHLAASLVIVPLHTVTMASLSSISAALRPLIHGPIHTLLTEVCVRALAVGLPVLPHRGPAFGEEGIAEGGLLGGHFHTATG